MDFETVVTLKRDGQPIKGYSIYTDNPNAYDQVELLMEKLAGAKR